jgi:hypothetical protein
MWNVIDTLSMWQIIIFFYSYLVYVGATGDKTNVVPVEINTGAIKMHHKQRLAV